MFRSIRGTLLLWHALIYCLVTGAFGSALALELRASILREIDAELQAHAVALAGHLSGGRGGRFELELPEEYETYFHAKGRGAPYYVLWKSDGDLIDRSDPSVDLPRPDPTGARSRGEFREFVVPGKQDTRILVGRGTHKALKEFWEFVRTAVFFGFAGLLFSALGGWLLVRRALAPVDAMSRTALAISGSDLSRRIDVAGAKAELAGLARTLNDAFDRLQLAFYRQAAFTADASHELRSPLAIVLNQTELALRKPRSNEEHREFHETCLKAALWMKSVVDGLLTLARADSGQLALKKERLGLLALAQDTVTVLKPAAAEKNVEIAVSGEPVDVAGDSDRLREVVGNLVTNAVRYNRPGGRVEISVRASGEQAALAVADTGIGIAEEDQAHIFERFYRTDKARSREQGGTGLGLAITRWIVEAHGGTISFTSRQGSGTTFTVLLPRWLGPSPSGGSR